MIRCNPFLVLSSCMILKLYSIFDISFSIGIDSDTLNLKKISTKVFSNDNIIDGLEYLIFTNNLLNSNITQEEDDDEW